MGLKLFDRVYQGMQLTPAGRLLHAHTTRMEKLNGQLAEAMEDFKAMRLGKLRIGASTTIGTYLLPSLLQRYKAHFPEIVVQLSIANTTEIEAAVLDGTLDFGMVEGMVGHAGLDSTVFANDELVMITSTKHPWAKRKFITPAHFLTEPYIAREAGSGTREIIDLAFAQKGLLLKPFMEMRESAVRTYVAAGLGVSILSQLAVRDELASGLLTTTRIRGMRFDRDLHLVRQPQASLSPAAKAAVQLIFGRLKHKVPT
jgi:DNA-binding transcriptional LysR family regulator